ncbi:hypothetical protein BP6252_01313 [Coleophoma cylindrospora]|uniref:PHD-type domain-containing protein n=1 Tax=Coleophoma cylindrospora TaxID=1849047 RepID=A0A3D8SSY4_9HELO|nr:hypothetical protein BP6252_01313 [Coleophoma cylindrospora]
MDANAQANGTGNSDAPMTDNSPPRPYVQQFSANTAMILQRIKSGVGGLGVGILGQGAAPPPGYEDMKRSVLQGMKTSMNMEIPTPLSAQARRLAKQSPTPTGASRNASGAPSPYTTPYAKKDATAGTSAGGIGSNGRGKRSRAPKAGTKRKRRKSESVSPEESDMPDLDDESDSDGSGSLNMPRMTQSGRQIVKPAAFVPSASSGSARKRGPSKRTQEEKNEQALCKRCGRGHSPQSNMIVFCDGCNLPWHQMCHDPIISDEAVRDETADWYCADCSRKKGILPAFDPTRGVSWQGRSTEQKRAYLQSLSHTQLVSLLLHSTQLFPNLPIFPATASQPTSRTTSQSQERNSTPQQPFPPSVAASSGLFNRADSNPAGTMNFIRKITPTGNTPSPSFPPKDLESSAQKPSAPHALAIGTQAEDGDAEASRESTPASPPYPKPGMGLMAKLGPDDQDDEWLIDNNDFDAFSHVVFEDGDAHAV